MDANAVAEQLRAVMRRSAAGVTIITSVTPDGMPAGMTATAFTSVSLDPPTVLVCANASSRTSAAIATAGAFAVNILAVEDHQLALRFGARRDDKFEGIAYDLRPPGVPVLASALASVCCEVDQTIEAGSHLIYLGRVIGAWQREGAPLLYADGRYGTHAPLE